MALDMTETTVRTDPEPAAQTTSRCIGRNQPGTRAWVVAALVAAVLLLAVVLVRRDDNTAVAPSGRVTTSGPSVEPVPSGSPFDRPQESGSGRTRPVPSGSPFDTPETPTGDR